uniref:Protein kinase domain-containing protein n=1 Tax=viral metagenome TaxID=1070528 RepID=A0A6C0HVI5_9ZZZZ
MITLIYYMIIMRKFINIIIHKIIYNKLMTDLKCPYDDVAKNYVIPTGKWLEAINKLKIDDINTSGTIIISELLEKEKVLVKVTTNKNVKLRDINQKIKGLPNFVYTFCVFFCNDYLDVILRNKEFCKLSTAKYKVTLEIMKFYNGGSITKHTINLKQFKLILKQLVLAQINLFRKNGITHNDIHSGNILIHKHSGKVELNYAYLEIPEKIISEFEFILSDYDKCVQFHPNNINENGYDEVEMNVSEVLDDLIQYTLLFNIIRTIKILLEKLNKDEKELLSRLFLEFEEKYQERYYHRERELLNKYLDSLKNKDVLLPFREYIKNSSNNCLNYFTKYYNQ